MQSGDAAEQIVRISLEGIEVAAKITGSAAKNIAALLFALLKDKDNQKTRGKQRLAAMLKSNKPLMVYSVRNKDMNTFVKEAKQYGVVYSVIRDPNGSPDGMTDVLVHTDDAPKINRIVERFKLSAVDKASIKSEIVKEKEAKTTEAEPVQEQTRDAEELLNDIMAKPSKERSGPQNPKQAVGIQKTVKSPPPPQVSEPTSEKPRNIDRGTRTFERGKSVKEELKEIKSSKKNAEAVAKPKARQTMHTQPTKKKKRGKSK